MPDLTEERLRVATLALKNYDFTIDVEKNTYWSEMGEFWSTVVYLSHNSNPEYPAEMATFVVEFAPNSSMFLDSYAIDSNNKRFGRIFVKDFVTN